MLVYTLDGQPYIEVGSQTSPLQYTPFDNKYHSSLPGLNPNFSDILRNEEPWEEIINNIMRTQSELVTNIKDLGGFVDGEGGGSASVNLPGTKKGWLGNVVAFAQSIIPVIGLFYLVQKIKSMICSNPERLVSAIKA